MILFFKPAVLNWDEIFLNLSMVPGMLHARPVDGAYWTLQYELTFALFVFILMFLKNVKWWVALWIVLSILLSFIGRNDSVFASLSVLLMANYSHTFLAGMMLYAIHRDKNNICLYIILILCIINQFLWGFSIAHDIFFIITLMLIWLVVPCEKYINQKKWFIRFIVWIAAISYPLYLIHQMIGFSIIHYLQLIGLNSEVYIIVPIGICILFAYLMHKYVELPFAKK